MIRVVAAGAHRFREHLGAEVAAEIRGTGRPRRPLRILPAAVAIIAVPVRRNGRRQRIFVSLMADAMDPGWDAVEKPGPGTSARLEPYGTT